MCSAWRREARPATQVEFLWKVIKRSSQKQEVWTRHALVQVLVVSFFLLESVFYELIGTCLVDVVLEPRQVEFIHTETDEVKQRFDVINRPSCRMHVELSD